MRGSCRHVWKYLQLAQRKGVTERRPGGCVFPVAVGIGIIALGWLWLTRAGFRKVFGGQITEGMPWFNRYMGWSWIVIGLGFLAWLAFTTATAHEKLSRHSHSSPVQGPHGVARANSAAEGSGVVVWSSCLAAAVGVGIALFSGAFALNGTFRQDMLGLLPTHVASRLEKARFHLWAGIWMGCSGLLIAAVGVAGIAVRLN